MINSLLFGGAEAHFALKDRVERLEMSLAETCSGGCRGWEETREGRARFRRLRGINRRRKASGLSHV